jgi:hypothetical protein
MISKNHIPELIPGLQKSGARTFAASNGICESRHTGLESKHGF